MSNEVMSALIGAAVAGIITLIGFLVQASVQRTDRQRRREELYIDNEIEALKLLYNALTQSYTSIVYYPRLHQLQSPHIFTIQDVITHLQPKILALMDAVNLSDLYLSAEAREKFSQAYDTHVTSYGLILDLVEATLNKPPQPLHNVRLPDDTINKLRSHTKAAVVALRPLLNPKSPNPPNNLTP